jgi:hypothetical protein
VIVVADDGLAKRDRDIGMRGNTGGKSGCKDMQPLNEALPFRSLAFKASLLRRE